MTGGELATPEGGFILNGYGDGDAIGVPLEKKRIMLEALVGLAAPGVTIFQSETFGVKA